MKYGLTIILVLLLLMSCSTRQIRENYAGVTEQRLAAHSINGIMKKLPEKHFNILEGESVFLECFFLSNIDLLYYARNRLEMALLEKYHCRLVNDPAQARFRVTVFFTALGTDFDKIGISTPELVLPGIGGIMSIDVIALEMYHGMTELYYYIQDEKGNVIVSGEMLKQVVRNDTLALPLVNIPVNTMD